MHEWLQWTLIAVAGVALLYLLFFFIVLLFISNFNKRLKKRREAMRLLLAQRKDITLALYRKIVDQKIKVSIAVTNRINELSNKEIGLFNHYEIFEYAPELEKVTKTIFEIAEVFRDLCVIRMDKVLSFGERKMLELAKGLLVKELAVSEGTDEPTVEAQIEGLFVK